MLYENEYELLQGASKTFPTTKIVQHFRVSGNLRGESVSFHLTYRIVNFFI